MCTIIENQKGALLWLYVFIKIEQWRFPHSTISIMYCETDTSSKLVLIVTRIMLPETSVQKTKPHPIMQANDDVGRGGFR